MRLAPSRSSDVEFIDAVAQRVIELLELRRPGAAELEGGDDTHPSSLTVAQVASRYGVSRGWVYAHQRELGAMRLGPGPRARLRFDSNVVARAIAGFNSNGGREHPSVSQSRQGRETPLIPFEPMS
jgi:hypothetical protein